MHKYLRAAGFSDYNSEGMVYRMIRNLVERNEYLVGETGYEDGSRLLEYRMPVSGNIGISAGIIHYESDRSEIQYYFPYFDSYDLSTEEGYTLEKHTADETFSGVVDDYDLGLSLIFFVNNPADYRSRLDRDFDPELRGVSYSAFSNGATIILPVISQDGIESDIGPLSDRSLFEAAQNGDESAIETLTATDLDMYRQISERIETEDLYSLVEQSFMPCGVECDQYSIVGEILDIRDSSNDLTGEMLKLIKISSNGINFWMCVRKDDVLGEPLAGRRIKCRIWMQGKVNAGC